MAGGEGESLPFSLHQAIKKPEPWLRFFVSVDDRFD